MSKNPLTRFLSSFLGQTNVLTIPRPLLVMCGNDHALAIMLSQSAFWSEHEGDAGGWFTRSVEEWADECGLSHAQLKRGREALAGYGLEWKRAGMPAQTFYRVDFDRFLTAAGEVFDCQAEIALLIRLKEPVMSSGKPPNSDLLIGKKTSKEEVYISSETGNSEPDQNGEGGESSTALGNVPGKPGKPKRKGLQKVPGAAAAGADDPLRPFVDAWNANRGELPSVRWPVSKDRAKLIQNFVALCGAQNFTPAETLERWANATKQVAASPYYREHGYGLDNMARHAEKHADAWETAQARAIRTPAPQTDAQRRNDAGRRERYTDDE